MQTTDNAALAAKLEQSRQVLARAMDRYGAGLWLAWTGGKDSTLAVWLARELCRETGRTMPRVLTIDEGDPFPEITAFMERLTREWALDVTVVRCAELLDRGAALGDYIALDGLSEPLRRMAAELGFTGPGFPLDPESPLGNQMLKVAPLTAFVRDAGVTALATAIRADEHPARAGECHESPRDNPPHMRIHPIVHLAEADVWAAIKGHDIPFCELYTQGYRSLGTRSGTVRPSAIPAWEQDLADRSGERAGRGRDKEEAMAALRALGYM